MVIKPDQIILQEDNKVAEKIDYKKSGVNLEAADQVIDKIKDLAKKADRLEVIHGIGGFAGLFALDTKKYQDPVLVSGTDGVGTKLKLAFEMDKHDTIGEDCVAMCVNDILVQGAEPLFFLDYLAVGELNPEKVAQIVAGVVAGCRKAGCALLGGETAEMPGFYPRGEYDLAGFTVGVVERELIIDGSTIESGDLLLGIASSGVHSNGFSLVRKVLEVNNISLDTRLPYKDENGREAVLGFELLKPTEIYIPAVLPLLDKFNIRGMAHITGGGLPGNLARILPAGLDIRLYADSWKRPEIFDFIREQGHVDMEEMYRVFNMGIGFVLIVSSKDAPKIQDLLRLANNNETWIIGEVAGKRGDGGGKVIFA